MADDKASGMKTAYELALERLESEGIERPRQEGLPDQVRREIEEVRQRYDAKLAEAEILHRDRLKRLAEPAARQQEKDDYVLERRRLAEERDAKVEALRNTASP